MRRVGRDAPAQLVHQLAGPGQVDLVVVLELRADRRLDEGHVGGRVLGGQVDRVDHALDVGERQVPDLEQRTDQPEPCHVRVVVLRLRGAGRPARVQKPGPEVELDGPHRESGEFTELADPHGGVPLTAVHPPWSGKHRSPCTRSVTRMDNPDGRFLRSGPSGPRRHGTSCHASPQHRHSLARRGTRPTRRPLVPREVFLLPEQARVHRPTPERRASDGPARHLPRLRHHPARRRAAGGAEPLRRRQAGDRPAARRARRGLHRGRLAGRQPQGHRVLPPGRRGARPAARQARGVRRHPPGRRAAPPTTRWSPRCATAAPAW